MPYRALLPIIWLVLAACEEPESDHTCPEPEPVVVEDSDCVPITDEPTGFERTLRFETVDSEPTTSFTSPMTRGQGILRAEASWTPYLGSPSIGFVDENGAEVLAQTYPDDTPNVVAEAMVGAGDTVTLLADQFFPGVDEDYPIEISVRFSFTPIRDCWEENDNVETAARVPLGTPVEGYLGGTFATYPEDAYWHRSTDDHYQVQVPPGASRLTLDASYLSIEGSIAVVVYPADATPSEGSDALYVGGTYGSVGSLEVPVEPGAYNVYVEQWEWRSAFAAWATKEPSQITRPDYWAVPYRLTVTAD